LISQFSHIGQFRRRSQAINYPEHESFLIALIMVDAAEWHEQLHYLSGTEAIVDDFENWGYTIYRTAHGPSTNQRRRARDTAFAANVGGSYQ
jgi:hypothetical protein